MSNFNEDKKYHFIYKTTNKLNGNYYIGMHSTNNLNDGYMGSGKRLKRSLKKYGKENFNFEIIRYYSNRDELVNGEKYIINEELIHDEKCLNLRTGGIGGFCDEKHMNKFIESSEKNWFSNKNAAPNVKLKQLRTNPDWYLKYCETIREGLKSVNYNHSTFKNKKHNEITKKKMKEVRIFRGLNKPEKNSQYGTCWITNGYNNKKIKKGENIPDGWRLGRIIKK